MPYLQQNMAQYSHYSNGQLRTEDRPTLTTQQTVTKIPAFEKVPTAVNVAETSMRTTSSQQIETDYGNLPENQRPLIEI